MDSPLRDIDDVTALTRRLPLRGLDEAAREELLSREWLLTNGLGGYASGTVLGVPTRRYHGLLIAAAPAPLGRMMMLGHLSERLHLPDGRLVHLGGHERIDGRLEAPGAEHLEEFALEAGLPVWRFAWGDLVLERRILLPHEQNTVHVTYRIVEGDGRVRLRLLPALNFRSHDAPVGSPIPAGFSVTASGGRYEVSADVAGLGPLRLLLYGQRGAFTLEERHLAEHLFRAEHRRGYDSKGELWSPGYFRVDVAAGAPATLVASSEPWETICALTPDEALTAERRRRQRIVDAAPAPCRRPPAIELTLAADSFLIKPAGRVQDAAWAHASGHEARTVIAGYHWFTDWGRDTMISLEGLTLVTGRSGEASAILSTFAHYVRDGLIPNLFHEGEKQGLYNTADATLWFFHAIDRYLRATGDRALLLGLFPTLEEIIERHLHGTRFGIHVDPADGLLCQGQEGVALTWMDAKLGSWVVTPRRGKAVEINALWYNALRLFEGWSGELRGAEEARRIAHHADRARDAFNRRFWDEASGHLFDVVDGESGDDPACRPNQIFAISLPHPVLAEERWPAVLRAVHERLLTPVGLRSLAPGHPDFKARYDGDLQARDAAYHQGTVWAWLIGAFVDAWLRVYPGDLEGARRHLRGFEEHMGEACVGQISEVFDAEPPYTPRACVAQAWSVAEVLRCWVKTAGVG